jgi:glycosyltransferase involved in cell wall biosynthesis
VDEAAGLSIEQDLDPADFDVLFCPLSLLDPLRPPMPAAVTIHGLGHEYHPENFDQRILELRRRTYGPAALNADLIFTVSQFSKRGIAKRYGIDADRIGVAPPGVSAVFTDPAPLEPSVSYRQLELAEDYVYYPANYWPDKNHDNLLRALLILRERFPRLELVLSGAPGVDADRVADLARELGVRDRVRMLGFVEQPLVCELARHSRAVPYVSQFEGFGIPIVEAMHSGAPVITSMAEACREVAGDAALCAPYDDPDAIAAEIERLLDDPHLAREMSVRGKRRAAKFDWTRSVALIAESLERIACPSHLRG